jgi:hypothetical protein
MTNQATQDLVARLNTATNNLATVVTNLRAQVKTDMTQDEVNALDGQLESLATQLEGIGQDPNNPIPAPTPPAGPTP